MRDFAHRIAYSAIIGGSTTYSQDAKTFKMQNRPTILKYLSKNLDTLDTKHFNTYVPT